MASVILNNLRANPQQPDYTYKDMHLDVMPGYVTRDGLHPAPKGKDIMHDLDEAAIKNSLVNIFNTIPGQRFLYPEFGCNINRYLFEAVTEDTAKSIAGVILDSIANWEERVVAVAIDVFPKPDENEYNVSILLQIPQLKRRTVLTGIFSKSGFVAVNKYNQQLQKQGVRL